MYGACRNGPSGALPATLSDWDRRMNVDETQFDVILDEGSETFVDDLKKALGLKPGQPLLIVTPQFTRTDGLKIGYFPRTAKEYQALKLMEPDNLKAIGCQIWNREGGRTHWLYPSEWYDFIPDGIDVVAINGETETFKKGETDNDIRFGALAYGFIQVVQ
jgi:hypothetical protein